MLTSLEEQEIQKQMETNETMNRQRISWQSKEGEGFASKEEINAHEEIEDILKGTT